MTWSSLKLRIATLPLILAGPILRRTEQDQVTVWVALKAQCTVTLLIQDTAGKPLFQGSRETIQMGPYLHIVAVTARPTSGQTSLIAGVVYNYDLSFSDGTTPVTLLAAYVSSGYVNDVMLGYGTMALPSFVLPAESPNKLRIAHVSCRKAHGEKRDALDGLDKIIELTSEIPNLRPQQLFMTGDQIYGDDVADALLYNILDTIDTLFGWHEAIPDTTLTAGDYKPGNRRDLVHDEGGMTSADPGYAKSHILGMSEYLTLYLMGWSDVLWPESLASFEEVRNKPETFPTTSPAPYLLFGDEEAKMVMADDPDLATFKNESDRLELFKSSLANVRRALANVPTYMMFDDHDVTDDWFAEYGWAKSVLGTTLGKNIIRNGLAAFAICQAWGNTPEKFEPATPPSSDPVGAELLASVSGWLASEGKSSADAASIEQIVGPPVLQSTEGSATATLQMPDPERFIGWDYTLSFPIFRVVVLDTRTHRRFDPDPTKYETTPEKGDFVALMDWSEIERQIPTLDPNSSQITILLSPAPIVGVPLVEELQKRAFLPNMKTLLDAEAWCLNRPAYNRLFARLAVSGKQVAGSSGDTWKHQVVCLSGDVHYGFTARVRYWGESPSVPAADLVFAQLTSSAAKNQTGGTTGLGTTGLHESGYNLVPTIAQTFVLVDDPPVFFAYGWKYIGGEREVVALDSEDEEIPMPRSTVDMRRADQYEVYAHRKSGDDRIASFKVNPAWRYRADYIQDQQDKRRHPETAPIRSSTDPTADRASKLATQVETALALRREREGHGSGVQLIGRNNVGLVYFSGDSWDEASVVHELWWRMDEESSELPDPWTIHEVPLAFDHSDYPYPEPSDSPTMSANTLYTALMNAVEGVLSPLGEESVSHFLEPFGWQLGVLESEFSDSLGSAIGATSDAYAEFMDGAPPDVDDLESLLSALSSIGELFDSLEAIADALEGIDLKDGGDAREIGSDLLEALILRYLLTDHPVAFEVLALVGLIDPPTRSEASPALTLADGTVLRKETSRYHLRLDRLSALLSSPADTLRAVYLADGGLDTAENAQAASDRLFPLLGRLLSALGAEWTYGPIAGVTFDHDAATDALASRLFMVNYVLPGDVTEVGAMAWLSSQEDADLGVVIAPYGTIAVGVTIGEWFLSIQMTATCDAISFNSDGITLPEGTEAGDIRGSLSLTKINATEEPDIVVGAATGTRLEVTGIGVEAGFDSSTSDWGIYLHIARLALVVQPAEGSSFLRGILGTEEWQVETDVHLGWSAGLGLHFAGVNELAVDIPVNRSIGDVVEVDSVSLTLSDDDGTTTVDCGVAASAVLGPFGIAVDGVGLRTRVEPVDSGGNVGRAELSLGFLFPAALGLSLDASVISGAGYLDVDSDGGRYAGVVSLQMLSFGLTAIGIVETEIDGDPDGWSLFLLVIADFTPVPLGFGFSLNGVGGFIGVNRTLDELALAEGVREGRLDSLLFPEDPLADASEILSDIEAYFPTKSDSYAFGVMARIIWGVPTIITAEVGVILTVPDYVIAIIGEMSTVLPDEDAPLLELHMGVVGVIDVTEGTIWATAAIYGSQLAGVEISGSMAMYLSFGADPYFLLSVGGFHPDWSPPASVPTSLTALERMSASIDLGDSFQAGLDCYFAVTSNSLQFGAELWAVASARVVGVDFTAEGWFGFDVLLVLTPFSLSADVIAGVSIKAKDKTLLGVQLSLHVEGPEPWSADGYAEFTFLTVDVDFRVDVGGNIKSESQSTVDLWSKLEAALNKTSAWIAPDDATSDASGVTLRALDAADETGLWLSPDGEIEIRQSVLPLNREIEVFGDYVPTGETRFDVEAAGLASGTESEWTVVEDWFAPAQYMELSEVERLSAPSFEEMDAGARIGATSRYSLPTEDLASVELEYEEYVVEDADLRLLATSALLPDRLGLGLVRPSSTGRKLSARRSVAVDGLSVEPTRYAVVDSLSAVATEGEADLTFADALVARRAHGTGRRVVPNFAAVGLAEESVSAPVVRSKSRVRGSLPRKKRP